MSNLFSSVSSDTFREIRGAARNYDYGALGDLRPGSDKHDQIVKMVLEYADRGYENNSEYVDEYSNVDAIRDGFMPADEVDRLRMADDPRKPINVVTPMLVAHEAQFVTAMHRAFFTGDVFHRFGGSGSQARAAKAALAQKLLGRLSMWFKERRQADLHWGDAFAYPRAFMLGKWSKKTRPMMVQESVDADLSAVLGGMGMDFAEGDSVRYMDEENVTIEEGTHWRPLDVYQVLTDDQTTPDNFQESAFFGWAASTDAQLLVQVEDDPEEGLFNCEPLLALARKQSATSRNWREHSSRSKRLENRQQSQRHSQYNTSCHVIYMFCRLIPRDFGLGPSRKPQWWFFGVGGDRILIKAERVTTLHGDIPVVCTSPNAKGHQIAPVSKLMLSYGQQLTVDYKIKRHDDHEDLLLNGKYLFDANMIEWERLSRGGGPMGIPMKKAARGKDISTYWKEIEIEPLPGDVWTDVANQIKLAEKGAGLVEDVSNMPDHTGSQGINAIESRSITQMARIALIIDEQSRQQMARQNLANAVQYMGSEVIVDITGRDAELIRRQYGLPPDATGLKVGPWDLDPELEIIALAAMSIGPKNVPAMTEFMKTLTAAVPEAMGMVFSKMHIDELLYAIVRELGFNEVDWYRADISPLPDEYVRQQAQAGNLVPMSSIAPPAYAEGAAA